MVGVTLDRRGRGGAGYSVAPILPALVDTTRPDQVDCTKLFLDALYTVLVAVKESYWFFLSLTKTQMFQNIGDLDICNNRDGKTYQTEKKII